MTKTRSNFSLHRVAIFCMSVFFASGMLIPAPVVAYDIGDWKLLVDARYRYENVSQQGFARDANASTLRTRLGLQTPEFENLTAFVEMENVTEIGSGNYNDTVRGRTAFPVVADPELTEINRATLTYKGIPDTIITGGRQRILIDNVRFVGNVGFRQNEQTFDAVRIVNKSIPKTTASYTYIGKVHRIFGDDHPAGTFSGDTHLINLAVDVFPHLKIGGYGYLVEIKQALGLSSRTFGIYGSGSAPLGNGLSLLYRAEYANQSDYKGNPADFKLDYFNVEGGIAWNRIKVLGGIEVLEGDGTNSFKTPLATLHKFQGFADAFLVTPGVGIDDLYFQAHYDAGAVGFIKKLKFSLWYHDFSANQGPGSLGNEVDAAITAKLHDAVTMHLKYADYNGKTFAADRRKFWLWFDIKI